MSPPVRILAIGSSHGSDQAGWRVADLLRERGVESVTAIQTIDQLIWHLAPEDRVILVDACQSGAVPGTTFRLRWPDGMIFERPGLSSHGIDVAYALRLAEALGRLPDEVIVYAIEISSAEVEQPISSEVAAAVEETAERILQELVAKGSAQRCMNGP